MQLPAPNECTMAELFEQIYALVLPSLNDDTWSDAYSSAYSYLRYACRKNLHQSHKIYISIKFVPPSLNDDTWSDAYTSAYSYLRYACRRKYISVQKDLYTIERWGAGVETQKNVRGVFGGWGRVPFNEPYAPSLSTIYDGA